MGERDAVERQWLGKGGILVKVSQTDKIKKREFDKLTAGSHCYAGNLTMEVVRFVKMEL